MDSLQEVDQLYTWIWTVRDVRVDNWLLMSSVQPTLVFLALYFVVAFYGPLWMVGRKPYNLKWLIFAYNMFVAVFNFHIFKELAFVSYSEGYNWLCQPVRVSTDIQEMRIVSALHLYLISKIIEFLDTVFIIARKKNNQLTFLHVYHHSSMLLLSWIIFRWVPGGNAALGASVNAFVHVFMYSYYGLSVLGPKVSKYLWWKRYLTILQLIQFAIGLVIGVYMFSFGCDYTRWMQHLTVYYTLSYLILFGRFYVSTYTGNVVKKRRKTSMKTDDKQLTTGLRYRNGVCDVTAPRSG